MAKKQEKTLIEQIERVIVRLLGCDSAPHDEQMEILDRAIKLAELKKKADDTPGFGAGFNQ